MKQTHVHISSCKNYYYNNFQILEWWALCYKIVHTYMHVAHIYAICSINLYRSSSIDREE